MTHINLTWGIFVSLGTPVWPWPVITNKTVFTTSSPRQEKAFHLANFFSIYNKRLILRQKRMGHACIYGICPRMVTG